MNERLTVFWVLFGIVDSEVVLSGGTEVRVLVGEWVGGGEVGGAVAGLAVLRREGKS